MLPLAASRLSAQTGLELIWLHNHASNMVYSSGNLPWSSIRTTMLDSSSLYLSWAQATWIMIPPGMRSMLDSELVPQTQSISLPLTSTPSLRWKDSQIPPLLSSTRQSLKHGTTTPLCGLPHPSPTWSMERSTGLKVTQPQPRSPGDAAATDSSWEQTVVSPPLPQMTPCISVASSISLLRPTRTTQCSDSQLSKTQPYSSTQLSCSSPLYF